MEPFSVLEKRMPTAVTADFNSLPSTSSGRRTVKIKTEPAELIDNDIIFVSATYAVRDEISEAESETDVDEYQETVWTLLADWGLEDELTETFTNYKISLEVLKNLSDDDLKVMIPDDQIALRVLLRTNLRKWQVTNRQTSFGSKNFKTAHYKKINRQIRNHLITKSQLHCSDSEDLRNKDLRSILKTTPRGRQVLEYSDLYTKAPLPKNWRSCLCKVICEFCVDQKVILDEGLFKHLSVEICHIFSNEVKETYFTPAPEDDEEAKYSGCLVDEYNKRYEKSRQTYFLPPSKLRGRKRPASPSIQQFGSSEAKIREMVLWLKYHRKPWFGNNGIFAKWRDTHSLRRKEFISTPDNEVIIHRWPLLQHRLGYTLVDLDFEKMYPHKSDALFEKWDQFCRSILPIYKSEIKDMVGNAVFKRYDRLQSKEMRDCYMMQMINSILIPSQQITIQVIEDRRIQKILWNTTIRDAYDSFFGISHSVEHAIAMTDVMTERYSNVGLSRQPMIIAIGQTEEYIAQFIVVYENIGYSVNSFLKALDITFKMYHLFNLEYNQESRLMWLFIQRYFYNIVTPTDFRSQPIENLLSRLK